ncbi:MAG TPA: VOC family protein [Burkholderiales bacterium]|nr:VOC family protein [Burkholderiales bacterium]
MFKRIDHVEIVTSDPERSVAFYTGVLGFKVRFRDRVPLPAGGALDIVYLDLGGTAVELLTYGGAPAEPAPQKLQLGYRMMALEVDDMKRTLEYLKGKGVDAAWGPVFREQYARAEIRDPNGYPIELRQWNR